MTFSQFVLLMVFIAGVMGTAQTVRSYTAIQKFRAETKARSEKGKE